MAKRAKTETSSEGHGVSAMRGNGFDPDATKGFVEEIEEVQHDIDEIMADAADECAPLYEKIDGIKKRAHDAGLPRKAFNAVLAERKALAKAASHRAKLAADHQTHFDDIKKAIGTFGDLPLGSAALAAAARNGSAGATA